MFYVRIPSRQKLIIEHVPRWLTKSAHQHFLLLLRLYPGPKNSNRQYSQLTWSPTLVHFNDARPVHDTSRDDKRRDQDRVIRHAEPFEFGHERGVLVRQDALESLKP